MASYEADLDMIIKYAKANKTAGYSIYRLWFIHISDSSVRIRRTTLIGQHGSRIKEYVLSNDTPDQHEIVHTIIKTSQLQSFANAYPAYISDMNKIREYIKDDTHSYRVGNFHIKISATPEGIQYVKTHMENHTMKEKLLLYDSCNSSMNKKVEEVLLKLEI